MRTQQSRSLVSAVSKRCNCQLAALLVLIGAAGACAGHQHALTCATTAQNLARYGGDESPRSVLKFDNQSTMYVDVYLVAGQEQWTLGRVLPGTPEILRVPESAIAGTWGMMQLVVIPGSQRSAQAWRDPRAIFTPVQSTVDVLSQRWTFRQSAGAPVQLLGMRL